MKKYNIFNKKSVLFLGLTMSVFCSHAQIGNAVAANKGTEFHIAYLRNVMARPTTTLELKIVVDTACKVKVQYNNQTNTYWTTTSPNITWNGNTIIPAGIYTANVTFADLINDTVTGTSLRTLSISSEKNISVYAINYWNASTDATCILPVAAWGTDYRLVTGEARRYSTTEYTAYAVVAKDNATVVTLHNGTNITLNRGEVYHFYNTGSNSSIDMTGERITATKPVAVFSGNTTAVGVGQGGVTYGCNSLGTSSADHTYEQMWSTEKWGTDFFAFPIYFPISSRAWGGMLGFVAHENNTTVTVSGGINGGTPYVYNMNAGEKQYICETLSGLTRIASNKPIYVFMLLPDISILTIPATMQLIRDATIAPFILTGTTNIIYHSIDILVPASAWSQTVIKENNVVVSNSTYDVTPSPHFPNWYTVRKSLPNTDTKIEIASPDGFFAYMTGSGSAESYGFIAGAGATDLLHLEHDTICEGDTVSFVCELTPIDINSSWQWFINDTAVFNAISDTFTFVPNNGDIIYCRFTTNEECVDETILYSTRYVIWANPRPAVSVSMRSDTNDICDGTAVTFTATPTNGGNTTYQWIINGRDTVGETGQTFTYQPKDGDIVQVRITSSLECATPNPLESDPLTMVVNPKQIPTISIRRKTN